MSGYYFVFLGCFEEFSSWVRIKTKLATILLYQQSCDHLPKYKPQIISITNFNMHGIARFVVFFCYVYTGGEAGPGPYRVEDQVMNN